MKIGYTRVSTRDQNADPQLHALREAAVERFFNETGSGGRWERPLLHKMLDSLRPGDEVVVWKLDRLSRSLKDFLLILDKIEAAGATFHSLTESIETRSASGRMMMQMLASFAEFERQMIRERTRAGIDAARAQGKKMGPKPKLTPNQRRLAVAAVKAGQSVSAVANGLGVHRMTIYRLLDAENPLRGKST